MSQGRVVALALGTQALLAAMAAAGATMLNLEIRWGTPLRDVGLGITVALGLALLNYWLLTRAPGNWLVEGVRRVYRDTIVPLFAQLRWPAAIAIGAAAGVAEESLFRGVLQPALGLAAASLLFGAAHLGTARMLPFAAWATAMGLMMGALYELTAGVTAPIVAHGLYDVLALEYVRREQAVIEPASTAGSPW